MFWLFCWSPVPNMCNSMAIHECHFQPFCIHTSSGANEGLQVFILLNVCVGITWYAPNAQDWMVKTCKSWFEWGFPTLDFLLQAIKCDPIPHGLSPKLDQVSFDHFVTKSHTHHLKCMNSYKCDICDEHHPHELMEN